MKITFIETGEDGVIVPGATYSCTRCHKKVRFAPGTEQRLTKCSCGHTKFEKKGR